MKLRIDLYKFMLISFIGLSSLSVSAEIIGNIDSVSEQSTDGTVLISGWACDRSQAQSIAVHLYANGAAGTPLAKFVLSANANIAGEVPSVSAACNTTKTPHHFQIKITRKSALLLSKQSIYIHGISVSKTPNLTIANSGKYTIPSEKKVVGYLDSIKERPSDGAILVSGWACDQFENKSISVHLYANGSAGSSGAVYLQSVVANKSSEVPVSTQCHTTSVPHRFEAVIPRGTAINYSNSPIFVHGISVSDGTNLKIARSGMLMPNFPVDQNLSQLIKDASGKNITGDLLIPEGFLVKIDTDINVKSLMIQGRLYCPDNGNFTIKASAIHVHGKDALLQCGTSVSPFQGKLKIAIKAGTFLSGKCDGVSTPCSDRNIMAMNGGTIRLIGNKINSKWLKLTKTAQPNDTEIVVSENVPWIAGDLISIAPTGFLYTEAEELIVKSVSGNRVTFTTPLKYRHNGATSTYKMPNKSWVIDERAEVANLNRNIQIISEGPVASMDYKGAHMMIMVNSFAYIDGAEFSYMGRMGEMARYPFHWHRVGDADGQYIKNSSIHHSFQRCITVHATNNTLVENNVCYDHYGHGFFLEDGNEVGNTLSGNLGMLSRRPLENRHILQSDIDQSQPERFPGPATFWVSNPNNALINNVSAGSQGTGFWMSFSNGLACTPQKCVRADANNPANVFPKQENTLRFDGNTTRTNMVGFTWDGLESGDLANNPRNPNDRMLATVHYSPKVTPEIRNMKAFKSLRSAMYTRARTMNFTNTIFADNRVSFFAAYNTVMKNSAIVAVSGNHLPAEYDTVSEFTGARIYDGPMDIRDIDFINFEDKTYGKKTITPYPFRSVGASERFGNVAQRIRFLPQPQRLINFVGKFPDHTLGSVESASLTDLDGSLTGTAHAVLVPNHAFNKHPSCVSTSDKSENAMICNYRTGQVYLLDGRKPTTPFQVSRSDGLQVTTNNFMNRVNLIYGGEFEYDLFINENIDLSNTNVIFKTGQYGDISPVVAIHNLPGQNCKVTNGGAVLTSLSALRAHNGKGYYSSKDILYIKNQSTDQKTYVTGISDAELGYDSMGRLVCSK